MNKKAREIQQDFARKLLAYEEYVGKVADREFKRVFKPYLDKKGYLLLVKEKEWRVIDSSASKTENPHRSDISHEDLPDEIKSIFSIVVYGLPWEIELGCFLESYNPFALPEPSTKVR